MRKHWPGPKPLPLNYGSWKTRGPAGLAQARQVRTMTLCGTTWTSTWFFRRGSPTSTRIRAGEYPRVLPPALHRSTHHADRLDFVSRSIRHLFRITYSRSDELTIAALITYLNAAMPPDKHEDFDTAEVTKMMTALHERGAFVFEGDVIRLPS